MCASVSDGRSGLRLAEVQQRAQLEAVSVEAPRQEVIGRTTHATGEPEELAVHGLALERQIERGEALWRVPPAAQ